MCGGAWTTRPVGRGFTTLSRDATAGVLNTPGLRECGTHVDWSSRTHGAAMGLETLAGRCASVLTTCEVVGLLFHHAVMDQTDRGRVRELLALISEHPAARYMSLLDAAAWSAAPSAHAERNIGEAKP